MTARKVIAKCIEHSIPVVIVGQRKSARGLVLSVVGDVAIVRDSVDGSKVSMPIASVRKISRFDSRPLFDASESDGAA